MTAIGRAIPLAIFMTASGRGRGRCPPLSACGIGRVAGEPGVSGGMMCERFLSPILPLSLRCGCSGSSLWGSAASSFPPVRLLER